MLKTKDPQVAAEGLRLSADGLKTGLVASCVGLFEIISKTGWFSVLVYIRLCHVREID